MIEIYDECKSAIINNKCSECNEFYSCYICDFVEERYQQGKAEAIDEVIKCLEAQFLMQNNPSSKFVETIVLHRDFIDALEQLKEQK